MSHPKDPHDPNFNPQEDAAQTNTRATMGVIGTLMLATGTIITLGGLFNGNYTTTTAGAVLIGLGFMVKP